MTVSKTPSGMYVVKSEKTGKRLSKPTTKKKAVERLRQVEWFKAHPK
jgi:hypothetical protein